MNQIASKFSVCCRSSSLLRKNPFTRWSSSSEPISSSSSNLLTVLFITKLHHHTFNYPAPLSQIPRNHYIREFSGEASECNFPDDDYLKNEISKIKDEEIIASCGIEFYDAPPLEVVEDLSDKFNALMEKLGLPTLDEAGDAIDYPDHLKRFREEIQDLVKSVDMTVAYGEYIAAGGDLLCEDFKKNYECMLNYHEILASLQQMKIRSRLMRKLLGYPSPPKIHRNHRFKKLSEGAPESNFGDDDYLKNEIQKVREEKWKVDDHIEMGNVPPLVDVVKVLADKFNALMEKLGLETLADDYDSDDDNYPDHLQRFRDSIEILQKYVDRTVALGEYVAAGGDRSWYHFMSNYRCMIKYEEILASLRKMKIRSRLMRRLIKAESDSLLTVS